MKAYCNELQNLSLTLSNLDTTISDNRLALQVLHGLSLDYRTFRYLVQHMNLVPSFDTLRSMLELEDHLNNKDISPSHDSALFDNKMLHQFCTNQGITLHFSCPHTSS